MTEKEDIFSKIHLLLMISIIWALKHERFDEQLTLQIYDNHFHSDNFCFKGSMQSLEMQVVSVMFFKVFQGNQTIILKKYTAGRKRKKTTMTNLTGSFQRR